MRESNLYKGTLLYNIFMGRNIHRYILVALCIAAGLALYQLHHRGVIAQIDPLTALWLGLAIVLLIGVVIGATAAWLFLQLKPPPQEQADVR